MPYKVLIVDDSTFFQGRLKGIINECPDLEVVGIASNGQEAIDKDAKLKPDVISMDYEMPFVDGITAVRTILASRSVPIVMFSSLTYEGARITLEALEAGAVDFIPKNFAEVSNNSTILKRKLHEKLVGFARDATPKQQVVTPPVNRTVSKPNKAPAPSSNSSVKPSAAVGTAPRRNPREPSLKGKLKILLIGASTGGPVAVTQIVSKLPADFPIPIVVVQHMPENFTRAFSERLNKQCALNVKEAEAGDRLQVGNIYVAPGGKQLMFDRGGTSLKILPSDERMNYKPSVDITFGSAAQVFGASVLGVMLTGMGADGCDGSRLLFEKGSTLWAQDKETCVVYGMPAAVVNAGLTKTILPIGDIAGKLISDV